MSRIHFVAPVISVANIGSFSETTKKKDSFFRLVQKICLSKLLCAHHQPRPEKPEILCAAMIMFSFAVSGCRAISSGKSGGLMQATREKPAARRTCSSAMRPAMSTTGT